MNKYDDRVKQRAEEMAKATRPELFEEITLEEQGVLIRDYLPAARLSVLREAEQWEEGFAFGYDAGQEYAEPDTEKHLTELGLIPPKTETT